MDRSQLEELQAVYRDGLLHDTLPFWLPESIDFEHGGFLLCRGRDGSLLDTDKGMWQHGRFTWLLSEMYSTVEARPEWLDAAAHGIDFMRRHGIDRDGRMFFQVTQDGRPLRKRRYVFTEAFGAIAFAAYARASGDESAKETAIELFETFVRYGTTDGLIPPKVDAGTRPCKGLAFPMILLVTAQILSDTIGYSEAAPRIDQAIEELDAFVRPDLGAVLEQVAPDGSVIDHFDGRTLNPGHAIEAAWFLMEQGRRRSRSDLVERGVQMLDWMWARGWDEEHGGLLYFVDLHGGPVQEYWHDMKFWWPHNEAIIATLLAHELTGNSKYDDWHRQVHDWAYGHFADPDFGEWYGYLHRDGSPSVDLKGNLWKGPFHLPRMQLTGWRICERLLTAL